MNIPIGEKIPAAEKETVEQPNKPPGWWSLSLPGSRAAVAAKVSTLDSIPAHWKAAIIADIEALETKYNFIEAHAHYTVHNGMGSLQYSITPSTALV